MPKKYALRARKPRARSESMCEVVLVSHLTIGPPLALPPI